MMPGGDLRLGVNIDHVATIRNARGGVHPDPARIAALAQQAGADGITFHLREDRRHIRDADLHRIRAATDLPLNMEMAATGEMLDIALEHRPETAMLVPEHREEKTTEGGLDVQARIETLKPVIAALRDNGSRVSLFIEADMAQLQAAKASGAAICEFHTGHFVEHCHAGRNSEAKAEYERIGAAVKQAIAIGIEPQAGHGLTYDTAEQIAAIAGLTELNIGHFLIGEALCVGLEESIATMRRHMQAGRRQGGA